MSTNLLMPDIFYRLYSYYRYILFLVSEYHSNRKEVYCKSFWALSLRIFSNLFTYYEMSLIILKGGYLWQMQK